MNAPFTATTQNERENDIEKMIAAFKRDVDYGLLRENLKCTVEQRLIRLMQLQKFFDGMRAAGRPKDRDLEAPTGKFGMRIGFDVSNLTRGRSV